MHEMQGHNASDSNRMTIPDALIGIYLYGVEFPFSSNWSSFLSALKTNNPCAVRLNLTDFWPLLRYAKQLDKDFQYPHNDIVCLNPDCFRELPSAARAVLPDEGREWNPAQVRSCFLTDEQLEKAHIGHCPFCGEKEVAIVCENLLAEEIEPSDMNKLWLLWKEHAKWLNNEKWLYEKELSSKVTMCRKCQKEIHFIDGYVIGGLTYCEECAKEDRTEERLKDLRRNPYYFGHGVIRRARQIAAGLWHPRIPCGGIFRTKDICVRVTFPLSFSFGAEKTNSVRRVFIFRNRDLGELIDGFWGAFNEAVGYLARGLKLLESLHISTHVVPEIGYVPNCSYDTLEGGEGSGLFGCGTNKPFVTMLLEEDARVKAVFHDKQATIHWFFFTDSDGGHGIIYAL